MVLTLGLSIPVPSISGLALLMLGTGMLKPNVSTIVGQLYSQDDKRRDAAFSIFYMGINVGALVSPLICGWVGEKVNWRWGFAVSAFGMIVGLIQYLLSGKYLGEAGLHPSSAGDPEQDRRQKRLVSLAITAFLLVIVVLGLLASRGVINVT